MFVTLMACLSQERRKRYHLPIELRCHVLGFLPAQDIIQCVLASVQSLSAILWRHDVLADVCACTDLPNPLQYYSPIIRAAISSSSVLDVYLSPLDLITYRSQSAYSSSGTIPTPGINSARQLSLPREYYARRKYFARGHIIFVEPVDLMITAVRTFDVDAFSGEKDMLTRRWLNRGRTFLDPSQDLIADVVSFSENHQEEYLFRIDLKTISDNTWHPSAQQPTLWAWRKSVCRQGTSSYVIPYNSELNFYGEHLVLHGRVNRLWVLQVFNWKSGEDSECVLTSQMHAFLGPDETSFCFLADRLLVLDKCLKVTLTSYHSHQLSHVPHLMRG
ncbi:hypothetical protein BS17DRAFT_558532 [Gyrodon lividus]|nr:hypothetical protein BS17DRAFT_558532 [Gyrodon lividus]